MATGRSEAKARRKGADKSADKGGAESTADGTDAAEAPADADEVLKKNALLEAICRDEGDGSYTISWWSDQPGTHSVFVKIAGVHIVHSPAVLHMATPHAASPTPPSQSAGPTQEQLTTSTISGAKAWATKSKMGSKRLQYSGRSGAALWSKVSAYKNPLPGPISPAPGAAQRPPNPSAPRPPSFRYASATPNFARNAFAKPARGGGTAGGSPTSPPTGGGNALQRAASAAASLSSPPSHSPTRSPPALPQQPAARAPSAGSSLPAGGRTPPARSEGNATAAVEQPAPNVAAAAAVFHPGES